MPTRHRFASAVGTTDSTKQLLDAKAIAALERPQPEKACRGRAARAKSQLILFTGRRQSDSDLSSDGRHDAVARCLLFTVEGEIVEQKEVLLASQRGAHSPAWAASFGTLIAPSPFAYLFTATVLTLRSVIIMGLADSHAAAIAYVLAHTWPVLLVLLLISAAAGWVVVRWQRALFRSHTFLWASRNVSVHSREKARTKITPE